MEPDIGAYGEGNTRLSSLRRQQGPAPGNPDYTEPGGAGSWLNQVPPTLAGLGTLYLAGYDGNSTYHSGQFKVQKPFSNGLTFLASYTWSKALDDTGGTFVGEADRGGAFQDAYNRHAEKGLAGQDVRHRFVVSYVYELPFGKGKAMLNKGGAANYILGKLADQRHYDVQSGSPFTVTQSFNGANNDVGQRRPDAVGNPNDLSSSRPRGEQVPCSSIPRRFGKTVPADIVNGPFRYGTSGRHTVIGPGLSNWISLFIKISESQRGREFSSARRASTS